MINPFPRRGEIWLVYCNPGRGSEQKGFRPAVIIQNDIGNQYGATTIVAAITTTIKIYPVTVFLKALGGGLKNDSMVNCAQILTISKDRLKKKIGSLDKELVRKIDKPLRVSLGLLVF